MAFMKNKLLVSGNNPVIVKDFFVYGGNYFDCLSTTTIPMDLNNHFQFFVPDAFLCFLDSIYDGTVEQLQRLRESPSYNFAPIIIVTKEENCEKLEKDILRKLADLILIRPITYDNIVLRIISYLEKEEMRRAKALEKVKEDEPDRKKHILIVDDDRNVLKLLKSALQEKYEVTATLNGLLVEKVLASKQIDLIVLDYEMPIMTGADVYRKLKENEEYAKIPVCFLTGVSERSKVEEIMSLRPNGYLLKPIDMEMLKAAIENLL